MYLQISLLLQNPPREENSISWTKRLSHHNTCGNAHFVKVPDKQAALPGSADLLLPGKNVPIAPAPDWSLITDRITLYRTPNR